MEEQKTSAYSFGLPLQSGGRARRRRRGHVTRLGEAGRLLGVAFQLVDDLLGVFGDPEATGKSVVSDLREGKQTPLLAHARSTPRVGAGSRRHLGRDLTERGADRGPRAARRHPARGATSRSSPRRTSRRPGRSLDELGSPPTSSSRTTPPRGWSPTAARSRHDGGHPRPRRPRPRLYDAVAEAARAVVIRPTPAPSGSPRGCSRSPCARRSATSTRWSGWPTRSSTAPSAALGAEARGRCCTWLTRTCATRCERGWSANLVVHAFARTALRVRRSARDLSARSSPRCGRTSATTGHDRRLRDATSTARPRSWA